MRGRLVWLGGGRCAESVSDGAVCGGRWGIGGRSRGSGLLLRHLLLLQHLLIPIVVGIHSVQGDNQIAKCVAKCEMLSQNSCGLKQSILFGHLGLLAS